MTQDCLNSPSTADVSKRLPKGIHVTGADDKSDPGIEGTPWGYLFIHNKTAQAFENEMKDYNEKNTKRPYFIHKTLRYSYKDEEKQQGVKKTLEQSVSGLVFLQGTVKDLQEFLADYFPQFHLVKDRSLGRPASIKDSIMQPFMNVMKTHPEQVTFLRDDFEKFAKDHVKLRVLTGPFKDYEGYIVRIDRDRQLVFDFGGRAVAIRGVHKEDFEVVEE